MIHYKNNCGKLAQTCGCCRTCYNRFVLAVKAGNTTWEELERQGVVDEPKAHPWTKGLPSC